MMVRVYQFWRFYGSATWEIAEILLVVAFAQVLSVAILIFVKSVVY